MKTARREARRRAAVIPNVQGAPVHGAQAQPAGTVWPYWMGAAAALVAVFVVYGPALNGPLLLDDSYLPYGQTGYANATLWAWIRGVRPLLMLTYWLNFQSSAYNSFPYHVVNALMHVLTGGLVFLILRKILAWAGIDPSRRDPFAAFGAALFLLHPLQTEAVSYIASRSEAQSVLLFLAAFTVFIYRRNSSATWVIAAVVTILFGAAVLTKEHAAMLPGLLLLTDYYWNPGFSWQGVKRNWRVYAPMAAGAVLAGVFIWKVLRTAVSAGFGLKDFTWYQYFFTQCRAVWRYILFFFLPVGQNIDHDFPVSLTLGGHGAWAGLLGLAGLIAAAWIYRKRFPLLSCGVFTFLLLLAPTSSILPIRDTLVERRMYLPFLGFVMVAIALLNFWKASRPALYGALAVVLLIEAGLSYQRNQLWGSAVSIWADSVSKSPEKMRPHFQLGSAYYEQGSASQNPQICQEAVDEFNRAAQIGSPTWDLLINWGLADGCAGNREAGLKLLRQSAALHPTAHIYSTIGMELAKSGEYSKAIAEIEKAIRIDPQWEMSYMYRGNIYLLQGDRDMAMADFRKVLQLDPENQGAQEALGRLSRGR